MTGEAKVIEHVTCLGCGCTCDDITVVVRDGRIAEARQACPLGAAWFGDGSVPAERRVRGQPVSLDQALDQAAALLTNARRPLVYLAPDISCETQRIAVAIADTLYGVVDGVTSSTVPGGTLAAQRRGRASATLGEIRNRADLLIFWGTDPAERYPRYQSRYAPDPVGVFLPRGRRDRVVIAVDIGDSRGPKDADLRIALTPAEELDAITVIRASWAAHALDEVASALTARIAELVTRLAQAHYAVVVYDAEPKGSAVAGRAEALIALTQQVNDRVRCALSTLRAGGNRNGAEAVLTWQTGFPMTVDYSHGSPRYRPDDSAAVLLERGDVDVALLVGNVHQANALNLSALRCIAIGPHASDMKPEAEVVIDTGVAGIHEEGMAFRMDDIPLPLRAPLPGSLEAAQTLRALSTRLVPRGRERQG